MIILKKTVKKLRIISLLLCLPLSGCFDITQEMWVYDNGRGRLQTVIGLHEQMLAMQGYKQDESACDEIFENRTVITELDGIESAEFSAYTEGGVLYCVADVTVDDFKFLSVAQDASVTQSHIGMNKEDYLAEFSMNALKDGKGHFREHIRNNAGDTRKPLLESYAEQFSNAMMGRMMAGRYWTVILHTPKIIEASGELSEDGKTVSWRVPLYDLLNDPEYAFDMQAKFEVDIPWYKKLWNWTS